MGYKARQRAGNTISYLFVIILGLIMFYPVVWLIASSFKTNPEILTTSFHLLPQDFTLENYANGWRGFGGIPFSRYFANSIFISVVATLGTAASSAVVAYGFTRIKFPGRQLWFGCMMMTLMLPGQIILIPQYIIFQKLHWINTYLPLIVPAFFSSAFFVFMIMQFIQGLPKELDEAATIDGCNRFGIFGRIILPLISPALVTTVIINFYWKWDEFLPPLLYLSRPEKYTVSIALKAFVDASSVTDYATLFAMSTVSLIPVFLLFMFFNRYLIEGISTSGLKG